MTGRSGARSALPRASSSACMRRPAALGRRAATAAVDAWARCAAEKRIVDVEIGERRESIGEGGIVRLLARVEAQVLQQRDIAGRKRSHGGLSPIADAIGDEAHREATECLRKRFGKRAERHGRHGLALGPAEVRGDDDPRAALCEFAQGWRHPVDPSGIAHRAFAHRHIQVHPNEDALTGDLDIVERSERRHAACGGAASVTGCRDGRRRRPSGWRSPIRCRTRRARGRAFHRPRRSGRHRRSSFPADD